MATVGAPIDLVAYDHSWPRAFAEERERLIGLFTGVDVVVEHVGSTAVLGLGSKPIIDILIGVSDISHIEVRIAALEENSYQYFPQYESQIPDRRFFRKPRSDPRTHHLHCVVFGSTFWRRHIAFRDYLRSHPQAAADYFELKQNLASRYRWDRDAYTEGKTDFVESILSLAGYHDQADET